MVDSCVFENQYIVGDTIQRDILTGQVEWITLKATYVRDVRGFYYIVPNGEDRIVANQNKNWACALVVLNIAYEEDLDRVSSILIGVADSATKDPDFSQAIIDKPDVVRSLVLDNWTNTMWVLVKTEHSQRLEITRELQKRVLQACARERISLSHPPDVWVLQDE